VLCWPPGVGQNVTGGSNAVRWSGNLSASRWAACMMSGIRVIPTTSAALQDRLCRVCARGNHRSRLCADEVDKPVATSAAIFIGAAGTLDPEQESTFRDNYLDVPLICRKCSHQERNMLDTIRNRADRMEISNFKVHRNDKTHIASAICSQAD